MAKTGVRQKYENMNNIDVVRWSGCLLSQRNGGDGVCHRHASERKGAWNGTGGVAA